MNRPESEVHRAYQGLELQRVIRLGMRKRDGEEVGNKRARLVETSLFCLRTETAWFSPGSGGDYLGRWTVVWAVNRSCPLSWLSRFGLAPVGALSTSSE